MQKNMLLKSRGVLFMLTFTQSAISSFYNTTKGRVAGLITQLFKNVLHGASSKGDTTILELLIKAGINKEVRNEYGQTPPHLARFYGHKEAVTLLREADADKECTRMKLVKGSFSLLAASCVHKPFLF